jgi:membrane peptidoglycan carboxypeptidase
MRRHNEGVAVYASARGQRRMTPESAVLRRRWAPRLFRTLLVLITVTGIAVALSVRLTPAVDDAPARVAALDASHHSSAVRVDATDRVARATVAAEDERFYSHHGVDTLGLLRAAWGGATGVDLGGSTIDQQLAKVLYPDGRTGLLSGIRDVGLALKFEGHYTKAAILSMYLSAVYYGHGYYGIAAASAGYFGVTPSQLTWPEAALLAGLPQAPTLLDPYHNLALAKQRQGYVLSRLVATGMLTQPMADRIASTPLVLRPPG